MHAAKLAGFEPLQLSFFTGNQPASGCNNAHEYVLYADFLSGLEPVNDVAELQTSDIRLRKPCFFCNFPHTRLLRIAEFPFLYMASNRNQMSAQKTAAALFLQKQHFPGYEQAGKLYHSGNLPISQKSHMQEKYSWQVNKSKSLIYWRLMKC